MFNLMGLMMGGFFGGFGGGIFGFMNMMNIMMGLLFVIGWMSGFGNIMYILYIFKNKDKYIEMYNVFIYILNIIVR